jgi:hypothetical protein
MNTPTCPSYLTPRPVLVGVERRATIVTLRDDPFFQGWGPKL